MSNCWHEEIAGYNMYKAVTKLKYMKPHFTKLHGLFYKGIQDRVQQLYNHLIQIHVDVQSAPSSGELQQLEEQVATEYLKYRRIE